MMTTTEADAHLTIIETIRDVRDNVIEESTAMGRMWRPLERFRPRCPGCRHVLAVSDWIDQVRAFRCNWCAVGWRECL